MSSFFTTPASQRKRKRTDTASAPAASKRNATINSAPRLSRKASNREDADGSISGSESENDLGPRKESELEDEEGSSESDNEDETAAERRLRLAERYLDNIKGDVEDYGFDAVEIDKDLIAERLKEDVAETKGRLYRRITSDLSFTNASHTMFRAETLSTTAIAVCPPYVYTASKDMTLIKWEIPVPPPLIDVIPDSITTPTTNGKGKQDPPPRRRPKKIAFAKGNKNNAQDNKYQGHVDSILSVAASQDGKFVVTGGRDRRLIVWNAADLKPLRVFSQHRDAVTGLVFRRGTNQLYSSSKDRTIKLWSLDELAYIETLFGHQDEVVDIAALAQENCVSVGARDRTARLWKVVEETQLVFRGGGGEKKSKSKSTGDRYFEGSIDRVAMIDEELFVTGSDNGSLSLWALHKKKPVFTLPLAHGLDPPLKPNEASAEQDPDPRPPCPPQPRWITALATVPYSDLIISGSWNGQLKVWQVSEDKRRIEAVGVVGSVEGSVVGQQRLISPAEVESTTNGEAKASLPEQPEETKMVRGVVNDISIFERDDKGKAGVCIVAALGKEHRLGRWLKTRGKNGAVFFEVVRRSRNLDARYDGSDGHDGLKGRNGLDGTLESLVAV
ncbi:MAG: pre-rRNA processing protein [Pycnora praestabilis]|nr:MAG: pre-rRNA processing protein [Pycnora praestabilis]